MRRFALLICLFPLFAAAAERAPDNLALQAANEQGLAERLARSYAWRLVEPGSADATRQYALTSAQFQRQLAQLQEAAKSNAELRDNYALLEQQWHDFQSLTTQPINAVQAKQVLEASEDMAWIASKGSQLQMRKDDPSTQAGFMAENVATLSQRLAKIYLLQSAGLNVPFLAKDLAAAQGEFVRTTHQLKAQSINTDSTRSQIALMETQWFFFQQALDALAANRQDASLRHNVVTTSDRIYEVAHELSDRYQRSAH